MKVDVILPAAGTSERMNLPVAKQFLKVLGKHILAYTVDCFHRLSWVRHIVITVSADQIEFTKEMMKTYDFSRVMVCAGSHSRHRSIFCGLKALKTECCGSDVIIIHDAARPFVSEQVARHVAEAAMSHGAAGVTRPLVSTVIRGDVDDRLVESLDRRLYRNSEMPQAFHYSIITSAYRQVTYQKDIYSMESIVKEKFMVVSIMNNCDHNFFALRELESRLYQRQLKIAENVDAPANTFVIVWDWQAGHTIGNITDKICSLYKQDMPSSAVKLDLMVVVIFLQNSYFTHTQTHIQENVNTSAESLQDSDRSGDCRSSNTFFNGGTSNSNAQSLNSELLLGCNSAMCNSSGTDNSNRMYAAVNCSSQQLHKQDDVTVKGLHSDPNFPITSFCKNEYNSSEDTTHFSVSESQTSSEDNTHFSLSESQRSDIFKFVDLTSQQEYSDYNTVKSITTMPVQTGTLHEQSELCGLYRDNSRCQTVVRATKDKLLRDTGGKCALVVGVLCEIKSPVGEQLAELIWQRSLYADGQVLNFANCLS